jgi:hypothetical protein
MALKTSAERKKLLLKHGRVVPREKITKVVYQMSQDWYYQNAKGDWFWSDGNPEGRKDWLSSYYGPGPTSGR